MKKRWKYRLANVFLILYTCWGGRLRRRASFEAKQNFNKIALFSSTALGDFLLNTPAIKAIRRRYPNAELILVASQKNQALVEKPNKREFYDRVMYWNNRFTSMFSLVKALKNDGPIDLAIILHSRPPYDVIASIMSGAHYIFRDNLMNMNGVPEFNRWLTNYIVRFHGHYIQRKLDLVSLLGAPINDREMSFPNGIAPLNRETTTRWIGFQLGASKESKTWPVSYYAELAKRVLDNYTDIEIVLIGSSTESVIADQFMTMIDQELKTRVINYVGKTDLQELIKVISAMNLLITGDTGPQHIAITLKIPTIGFFINTDPRETGPYQDQHLHTILSPTQQMLTLAGEKFGARGIIKPVEVLQHITSILQS